MFFDESSLDHMISLWSGQYIALDGDPGTPKHDLEDLMKQSLSSYQLCEEGDHSSYFDDRLNHQSSKVIIFDFSNQ